MRTYCHVEFVDYLVTDKANVNYLKSQLLNDEWSMYMKKLHLIMMGM
jgi:hypothetical protein